LIRILHVFFPSYRRITTHRAVRSILLLSGLEIKIISVHINIKLMTEPPLPAEEKGNSLWNHFTRKEEYDPAFRDQYGRFPYYLSSYRDVLTPSVSQCIHERGFRPDWPDSHTFAVCLTHDIDTIYTKLSDAIRFSVKAVAGRQFSKATGYLATLAIKKRS